jgi:hypothetical protein
MFSALAALFQKAIHGTAPDFCVQVRARKSDIVQQPIIEREEMPDRALFFSVPSHCEAPGFD